MIRVFAVGMAWLLVLQVVAGAGFMLGYLTTGAVVPGAAVAVAAVALLVLLPLAGELVVEFDSLPREVKVSASWWMRVRVRLGNEPELLLRVLGIPIRRTLKKRPKARPEPKPDMGRWARENVTELLRLAMASLQALGELACHARALALTVNAPAETDAVDQILAGVVGRRSFRLLDVKVLPEGPRRVRGLFRAAFRDAVAAGVFVLVQGRALALMRSLRRARRQAEAVPRTR